MGDYVGLIYRSFPTCSSQAKRLDMYWSDPNLYLQITQLHGLIILFPTLIRVVDLISKDFFFFSSAGKVELAFES